MQYLCLCYYNIQAVEALDEDQQAALGKECQPHDEALRATGKLVALGSLADPADWCNSFPGREAHRNTVALTCPAVTRWGRFLLLRLRMPPTPRQWLPSTPPPIMASI